MSAVKVEELMSSAVVTVQPHHSVSHVREKFSQKKLSNVPVVSPDGEPLGVVSASDLLSADKEGTPVSSIMTEQVFTVPEYEEVSIAARIMRNHKIHHLIVS
jgi:CBS domain-containing protein